MNKIIENISLSDFDYELPKELIALYPTENRSGSRLLYYSAEINKITHHNFSDICDLIPENSLLILNKTKVIQARLMMTKPTGGNVELLLVEPMFPSTDPVLTLANKSNCIWECIIGGKRVNEGMILKSADDSISLTAEIISRESNTGKVGFSWNADLTFSEIISKTGKVPLPPYIERSDNDSDKDRYQTVFAKDEGSIAAPTAGLHFTDEILTMLSSKGISMAELTLHVGPGTFVPVSDDDVSAHKMHSEQIFVTLESVQSILDSLKSGKKIICVGTTSVRTLESLYWFGIQLIREEKYKTTIDISQWEPYESDTEISPVSALRAIEEMMIGMNIESISGRTSIMIVPGYKFRLVNGLITNFHLPRSTLILLVAAFAGQMQWRKIYESAIDEKYRFLSYQSV